MSALARSLRLPLAILALGFGLMSAAAALAGQPVSLRQDLQSSGSVTLGDLFDGAGPAAGVVVGFGAPTGQSAVLDAGEVQRLAHVHGLDWDNPRGIRRIIVLSVESQAPEQRASAPSRAVEALTYARNLAPGETVQPGDVVYAKVASAPADAPRNMQAVVGMEAKRPLLAGTAVSERDVAEPMVIKHGDVVDVTYHDFGITLVMQGQAMADARVGDPVSIVNPMSKKVLQTLAVGPDQAVVGPQAQEARSDGVDAVMYSSR